MQEKKDKDSVPATEVNTTETFSINKKKKYIDLSKIVYDNYKKNKHYVNKCFNSKN